jgi:hypothetical protein
MPRTRLRFPADRLRLGVTFAGSCHGDHAGRGVDGDAADVVAYQFDLAGMQAATHRQAERLDRAGDRCGAAHRARRAVERGEKAVAQALHLVAAKPFDLRLSSSARHRRSPSSAARFVESTMLARADYSIDNIAFIKGHVIGPRLSNRISRENPARREKKSAHSGISQNSSILGLLRELAESYAGRGVNLVRLAGGWALVFVPGFVSRAARLISRPGCCQRDARFDRYLARSPGRPDIERRGGRWAA